MQYEIVIGLEIHAQLQTRAKMFSAAKTDFGAAANAEVAMLDAGLPGTLPVANQKAVEMAVKFGLAIDAKINRESIFERKNYFYPDLPKGYQISQFEHPIVGAGKITIDGENGKPKIIRIIRAHLEEDAGKSVHDLFPNASAIDLNRAGVPLLEIVSMPDLASAHEAVTYAKKIHTLVRWLGICNGNMQEGSLRFDANISLRPENSAKLGTRTEIKNLNSFRFLERALNLEIARQRKILEGGGAISQQTRLYDEKADETRKMRGKEESDDYRYFPDPDLLPLVLDENFIDEIQKNLPELPAAKKNRFIDDFGLDEKIAAQLTSEKPLADYFEKTLEHAPDAKLCANWITGEVAAFLNKHKMTIENSPVKATTLGELLHRMMAGKISAANAKTVFQAMARGEGSAAEIIKKRGFGAVQNAEALAKIVAEIIESHPDQVRQYQNGNTKILGFFIGMAMKKTQGNADPKLLNDLFRQKLKK